MSFERVSRISLNQSSQSPSSHATPLAGAVGRRSEAVELVVDSRRNLVAVTRNKYYFGPKINVPLQHLCG